VLWSSQVYNKDLLALGPLGRGRPTELEDEHFDVAVQRGQVVDDFLTRLEWELRSLVSDASRGWRILQAIPLIYTSDPTPTYSGGQVRNALR
jgi:hypothetical protein